MTMVIRKITPWKANKPLFAVRVPTPEGDRACAMSYWMKRIRPIYTGLVSWSSVDTATDDEMGNKGDDAPDMDDEIGDEDMDTDEMDDDGITEERIDDLEYRIEMLTAEFDKMSEMGDEDDQMGDDMAGDDTATNHAAIDLLFVDEVSATNFVETYDHQLWQDAREEAREEARLKWIEATNNLLSFCEANPDFKTC
jgi:hypothetical protein